MKKSILIIATVVLSILNVNATTNLKEKEKKTTISGKFAMEYVIKVYDWELEIENGKFSGTALTQEGVERIVEILSKGEIVRHKKVISYYVLQNEYQTENARNFYWEVKSKNSYAEGFASTKNSAQKMIKLVAGDEIITFKIIKSKK